MISVSPIALFVYNRPWHTAQTIEALRKNELADQSELFIYFDAAKNQDQYCRVAEVRDLISKIEGFKSVTIIQREQNLGLAENIISGVTEVVNEYGKVIVLEDDLPVSPMFLRFMNDALNRYQKTKNVWQIGGYVYPNVTENQNNGRSFFTKFTTSWGWATWSDRWQYFEKNPNDLIKRISASEVDRFNLDGSEDLWSQVRLNLKGKLNTWAVFWYAAVYLHNGFVLYPPVSLVTNIGHDGTGQNCVEDSELSVELTDLVGYKFPNDVAVDKSIDRKVKLFLRKRNSIARRLWRKAKLKRVPSLEDNRQHKHP